MKYRKLLALFLAGATTLTLGLTGCGGNSKGSDGGESTGSGKGDTVTIKWLSQGTGAGSWEEITQPILEAYEEATGTHVDAEFYSFDDLFQVIETRSAAGDSDFDVMSVDVTYVAKYGSSGYLEPLDQYFTDEDKAKWDDASYQAGVWDDTM